MDSQDKAAGATIVVYTVTGAAYIVAAAVSAPVRFALKPLLMPLLMVWVWIRHGRSAPVSLYLGLFFAMLGDTFLMPSGELWFLAGMGAFLAMQLIYTFGFVRLGARQGLARRKWIPLLYAMAWIGANAALGPSLGPLQIPVVVYSAALATMAAMAAGVSGRVGWGGLLFLISDALIGAGQAGLNFTGRGSLVMLTYLAAQYLIVTGWSVELNTERTKA